MALLAQLLVLVVLLGALPLVGVVIGVAFDQPTVVLLAGLSFAGGMALVLAIWGCGLIARYNRVLLVVVFAPLLVITNIALVPLIAINGGVLTFALSQIFPVAALFTGLGTALGVIAMLNRALSLPIARMGKGEASGLPVGEAQEPRLWAAVRDVAQRLGTAPPANLLVGLDMNFYASDQTKLLTGAVDTDRTYLASDDDDDEDERPGRGGKNKTEVPELKGRTVYVSLPLSRIMTVEELKAVLAHELAHFRGWDTRFTRVFYPVWRGAALSLYRLSEEMGESFWAGLALMPAYGILVFFIHSFAEAEARLNRMRELAADRASVETTDAPTAAAALVKIHGFSRYWRRARALMREKVAYADTVGLNVCDLFAAAVEEGKESVWMRKDLDEEEPPHPTDTHPPLSQRLAQLKLTMQDVAESAFSVPPESPAASLLEHADELESALTEAEKRRMIEAHEVNEGSKTRW